MNGQGLMTIWQIHWGLVTCAVAAMLGIFFARKVSNKWVGVGLGQIAPFVLSVVGLFIWMSPNQPIAVHDFYHYRFEALYLKQLGYDSMYECAIAALPADLRPKQYRSQTSYDLKAVSTDSIDSCQMRLGSKWGIFKDDVANMAGYLGPSSLAVFVGDHGFNGSPFWAFVHSRWMPMEFKAALIWSSVINYICLIGALVSLGAGFGWGRVGLAALCAMSIPLADSSWIAGAPGRYDWVLCVSLALCFAKKRRWEVAALFAGASGALRVFPLAGFIIAMAALFWSAKSRSKQARSLAIKAVLGSVISFAICMGVGVWEYGLNLTVMWMQKISLHETFLSWNTLGSRPAIHGLAYLEGMFAESYAWPNLAWMAPFALIALLGAMLMRMKPTVDFDFAMGFGFSLVFWMGSGLSHYYWIGWICAVGLLGESLIASAVLLVGAIGIQLYLATLPQVLESIPFGAAMSSLWLYVWEIIYLFVLCWREGRKNSFVKLSGASQKIVSDTGEVIESKS